MQRENVNAIFTSDKLDKSDDMVDAVNNLKIHDSEYHESNTAAASDAQGDLTRNPETVIFTRNVKFEQNLLSNQTMLILPFQ